MKTSMSAIRLAPKRIEKRWGRRDLWPAFASVPAGGAAVGEILFEMPGEQGFGNASPELLIKYLFTGDRLSVQVHPDDAAAQAKGYPRGKDEAWVILDAEPHASIAIGTLKPMTKDELRAASIDGSIAQWLDWKAVKKDDSFYTSAGTLHAIGPGLTLVEVQQNVNLTYRLYDYGSGRKLHLDEGVAASNPVPYVAASKSREVSPGREVLADGPKFVLERWRRQGNGTLKSDGRRIWLIPLSGRGTIDGGVLEAGGVWMVEGETTLTLGDRAGMLVAYPQSGVIEPLWS